MPEANPSPTATRKKESEMSRFLDNIAAALITVPFAIAAVSMLVTVLSGGPV